MENTKPAQRQNLAELIDRQNDLLALPEPVSRVIELVGKEEVNIEELSAIISRDPALTGRLLKIANSPFYGLTHRVSTIHQAMMVLGLRTVMCLALSAAIFDPHKVSGEIDIDLANFYGNTIMVAVTGRKLAVTCGHPAPEEAFTAGLLHGIGVIYFMQNFPHEYNQVMLRARESGSLLDEEKTAFVLTHPEVGEKIAKKWRLPDEIASAIGHHGSCGRDDSRQLDDILRLAVALNRDAIAVTDEYLEDKIVKISVISERLGVGQQQLDDITLTVMKDTIDFARLIEVDIGDFEGLLTRANQEIFKTYMSIQKLFRERQELTNRILDEERERGILEAKQVAVSTLSHYINNAAMSISGQSQVIRLYMKSKSPEEIMADMPRVLDHIDEGINKIVAVLEEISELNMLDDIEYFDQSKILNIDQRIKERLERFKTSHGMVLPADAEDVSSV